MPSKSPHAATSSPPSLTFTEKVSRHAKLLPATIVHFWRLASSAFKILLLVTTTVSVLLIASEMKVRDLSRTNLRPSGFQESGRRMSRCTNDDPCRIQMVADLDTLSKGPGEKPTYTSKLLYGKFWFDADNRPQIAWGTEMRPVDIVGKVSEDGRGMELSELVDWKGQLLSFDDRTGIVYELMYTGGSNARGTAASAPMTLKSYLRVHGDLPEGQSIVPIPKYILSEEPDSSKGMKIEWACEKDNSLYVGSFGKEYTSKDGSKITGEANFWIVRIGESRGGSEIERINWKSQYQRLREITGTSYPGYLIHEAVNWSDFHQRWFFLPRRVSKLQYDEKLDEARGSNLVISIDEHFQKYDIYHVQYPTDHPARGFSSFKFVPGTKDLQIMALRTEEDEGAGMQKTYLSIFDTLSGALIMPEMMISPSHKFEGVEIW